MKRLLFVNGHLKVGGIERTLIDLLNHIDYNQYEVDLLLLEEIGVYESLLPPQVRVLLFSTVCAYGPLCPTLWTNLRMGNFRLLLYRLILLSTHLLGKRMLSLLFYVLPVKGRYDVAIAYRPGICAEVVGRAIKSEKKLLWWHHGKCSFNNIQYQIIYKTWRLFDKVVFVSEGCKKIFCDGIPYLADRMIVLQNMIDANRLELLAGDTMPVEYTQDSLNIVSVGNLLPDKHFDNAIQVVLELVKRDKTNIRWYIIGDGIEHQNLELKIMNLNLENYVYLIGQKSNPYPYIKYADLLVHPSYIEAQSTTVLEAMALHTPCVVTRTEIPQDFTINGINCIEVEQGVSYLFDGVSKMISMIDNVKAITGNAFELVLKHYSPEIVISRFYSYIE